MGPSEVRKSEHDGYDLHGFRIWFNSMAFRLLAAWWMRSLKPPSTDTCMDASLGIFIRQACFNNLIHLNLRAVAFSSREQHHISRVSGERMHVHSRHHSFSSRRQRTLVPTTFTPQWGSTSSGHSFVPCRLLFATPLLALRRTQRLLYASSDHRLSPAIRTTVIRRVLCRTCALDIPPFTKRGFPRHAWVKIASLHAKCQIQRLPSTLVAGRAGSQVAQLSQLPHQQHFLVVGDHDYLQAAVLQRKAIPLFLQASSTSQFRSQQCQSLGSPTLRTNRM